MSNYCDNTLGNPDTNTGRTMVKEPSFDTAEPVAPAPVYVEVKVEDPTSGQPLPHTSITVTMDSRVYNSTVSVTSDLEGNAMVPVLLNGHYEVVMDAPTYIEAISSFDMTCYGETACNPEVSLPLAPQILTPGDVRLITTWSGEGNVVDVDLFEVSTNGDDCTSSKASTCGKVAVETPQGSKNSLSMYLPTNTNGEKSYMIFLKDAGTSGNKLAKSSASVGIYDSSGFLEVKMPNTYMPYQNIESALLFGGWKSMAALEGMSSKDKRNALVVHLKSQSNVPIKTLEELTDTGNLGSLTGVAAISSFLSSRSIRTAQELKNLGYEEQRNTLIADLSSNAGLEVAFLSSLSDFELVSQGFETSFYNTRSITPASFGQSYWLVGCLSNSNGEKVFKEVNEFRSEDPSTEDRLFCQNLLNLGSAAPVAKVVSPFWNDKALEVFTRNAVDNTLSPVYLDVTYRETDASLTANQVVSEIFVLQQAYSDGTSPLTVPLSSTGAGLYSLVFSGDGMVTFTEEVELDETSTDFRFYTTMTPTPKLGDTRAMLTWDASLQPVAFSTYQVDTSQVSSALGCQLTGSTSCNATVLNVQNRMDGSLGGSTITILDSPSYNYMLMATLPPNMATNPPSMEAETPEAALQFLMGRSAGSLASMSSEDKRNTLIVDLNSVTSHTISELQAMATTGTLGSLVGLASISGFLLTRNIRTSYELSSMSYDDQRNTLIVDFNEVTGNSISSLQAMGDFALTSVGFSNGSKTTTKKTYDIPYNRYLSKAPDGYSCKKNSKDKKQYCLCNQGERIVKFSSKHYNKQEDRIWDLGCKAVHPELTIKGDRWISKTERNKLDKPQLWNGVHSNSFLVGMESEHDNGAEDRAYSFFTARSDNFALHQCSGWKKLNDFDEKIDLKLGDEEVIAAIKSVHSNKDEDREFSVITCKIARKAGKLFSLFILISLFGLFIQTGLLSSFKNIATGEASQDITPFHSLTILTSITFLSLRNFYH